MSTVTSLEVVYIHAYSCNSPTFEVYYPAPPLRDFTVTFHGWRTLQYIIRQARPDPAASHTSAGGKAAHSDSPFRRRRRPCPWRPWGGRAVPTGARGRRWWRLARPGRPPTLRSPSPLSARDLEIRPSQSGLGGFQRVKVGVGLRTRTMKSRTLDPGWQDGV